MGSLCKYSRCVKRTPAMVLLALASLLVNPASSPAATEIDIFLSAQDVTILGADASDHIGRVVAVGDLNDDSHADLVVATPYGDGATNGIGGAGEVYVFFGPFVSGTTRDLLIPGSADVIIYGEAEDDNLGNSVAVGDVSGDAINDLVIGADGADPDLARPNAGKVYVLVGPLGADPVVDLATVSANITIFGRDNSDKLGCAVAVGDLDSDGVGDLVAAAWGGQGPGNLRGVNTGEAYVLTGPLNGGLLIDLAVTPAHTTVYGHTSGGNLGIRHGTVQIGDLDDDGSPDLVFGIPETGPDPSFHPGEVQVLLGPLASGDRDLLLAPGDARFYGRDDNDKFGENVAVGDVTGDGRNDLLVGAWMGSGPDNDRQNAGEAYVFFGPFPAGTALELRKAQADVTIYGADGITPGDSNGDQVGYSVALGRCVNGIKDVVLGASGADGPNEQRYPSAGEAYVLSGPFVSNTVIDLAVDTPDITVYGAWRHDTLGWSVATGTFSENLDTIEDLLTAAHAADPPGVNREYAGEAYGIFRPPPLPFIRGTVWADLNCNGSRDPGEPGLWGITVKLYAQGCSVLLDETSTDSSGSYVFNNLVPGTYCVEEENLPGWQSCTADQVDGVVAVDPCVNPEVNFGDRATIAPNAPSFAVSLGVSGQGSDSRDLPANCPDALCFRIENSGSVFSEARFLAFTAAIEHSDDVLQFVGDDPEACWGVGYPDGSVSSGVATGALSDERHGGGSPWDPNLYYRMTTWDLPQDEYLAGKSGSAQGTAIICFLVESVGLPGQQSKVELFPRSSEDHPSHFGGQRPGDLTEWRNLWMDSSTALWYPVHNSLDPWDDAPPGGPGAHVWKNWTWQPMQAGGYAKESYQITLVEEVETCPPPALPEGCVLDTP